MKAIDSCANDTPTSKSDLAEKVIQLSNRALDFIEKHLAVPVIVVGLGIFGSMGKTAIKAGWTPEQVIGLCSAFPVQISIPTLNP